MWPQNDDQPRRSFEVHLPPPKGPAQVKGVSRDPDNSRSLIVYFDRAPTDTDMRRVQDTLKETPHGE